MPATPALRRARLANIAPVQDQPVMGVALILGGHVVLDRPFDDELA